jgi:hypothetical protein
VQGEWIGAMVINAS